ncbi:hypothetical protein JXJ21_22265 [candidate division KSB1 bacterium]|nr:hypothetical protein [candidate division KSB1 bacterium]
MKLERIFAKFKLQLILCWIIVPCIASGADWYAKLLTCATTQQDTFFYKSTDSQILAWNESFVLRTYLSCYQIEDDSLWIDKAIHHCRTILSNMRDFPEVPQVKTWDGYRDGFSGWGTIRQNRYQELLFHDAIIAIPILRFTLLINQNPATATHYGYAFSEFTRTIEANIIGKWRLHWEDARESSTHDGSLEQWNGWDRLPHHQYAAMGTVFCLLARLVDMPNCPLKHPDWGEWYTQNAFEMANFLKSHLKIDTQLAAYYWDYDLVGSRIENINQGDFTLEFMLAAKENRLVFDDMDLFRLLNTLRFKIWNQDKDNPQFYYCVNGGYSEDSGFQLRTWVFFSLLDLNLQAALHKNLSNYINQNPILNGELRCGKTSCTIANLAYVLKQSRFFQQKAVH